MFRQILILFIFLASALFFKLAFLPSQLMLLVSFASTFLIVLVVIIRTIYDNKPGFKQNFSFEVFLFLISVVFAMLGAKWGHGQGLLLSAWVESSMYFYFFYFFLHALRIRPKELERLIIIVAVIYLTLFFAQYVLYPRQLFNSRVQEARGTVRIFVPGGIFANLMFFYFLLLLFKKPKILYAVFCFLYVIIPVLQGTRSSILVTVFAILVVIVISKQVKSKLLVLFLMSSGAVLLFFIFQDIFMNLIEVSQDQSEQEGDDIRVKAIKFFLTEFYPNKINYFLGNGMGHMASPYGLKIMYYKAAYGFYQSDIGILGNYTIWGVTSILGIFLTLRKMFLIKIQQNYKYIKFWAVPLVIASILGSPFFGGSNIVVIVSALYLLDVSNYELYNAGKVEKENNV